MDIKREQDRFGKFDAVVGTDLELGPSLYELVINRLLIEAKATPENTDVVPANPRGWWKDGSLGSLLWLHQSKPKTDEVLEEIRQAAVSALQPMIDEGYAARIEVVVAPTNTYGINLRLFIFRNDGTSEELRFSDLYDEIL